MTVDNNYPVIAQTSCLGSYSHSEKLSCVIVCSECWFELNYASVVCMSLFGRAGPSPILLPNEAESLEACEWESQQVPCFSLELHLIWGWSIVSPSLRQPFRAVLLPLRVTCQQSMENDCRKEWASPWSHHCNRWISLEFRPAFDLGYHYLFFKMQTWR
jgi:hypothetical protein